MIRRYGVLNTQIEPDHKLFGIPFPGTLVLDAEGRVTERFFEDEYQFRMTGNALAGRMAFGAALPDSAGTETREHLSARIHVSDAAVAPGQEFLVTAEVAMNPGLHVYAPGDHTYIVTRLEVAPDSLFTAVDAIYPESKDYHFKPLDEHIPVFDGAFTIRQVVRLAATREIAALAMNPGASATLEATLHYQACDDKVCFMPESIPVSITIGLKPLER